MNATPSPGRYLEADWKQFLRLGEQLIQQGTTRLQCELIEQLTQELIGGTARVWLSRPTYPLPGDEEMELLPAAPAPDIVQRARLEARPLYANGTQLSENPGETGNVAWIAAVPLITNQSLLGILYVERSPDSPLESQHVDMLEGLVGHSAAALEISREKKINHWRLQQLGLVRKVSAQITGVLKIEELCEQVTGLIQSTFQYYYVAIFTQSHDGLQLDFRASASHNVAQPLPPGFRIPTGQGLIGMAAQNGEQIVVPDALIDPHFRFMDALPETLSEACIPLKNEDAVLGVLDVQSDVLDGFHEIDIMVLGALSDTIALAIKNARLYTDIEERAAQLSSVAEVSHALNSILELDDLLKEVVKLIQNRFNYPHVHIFSVHSGRRLVIYQAGGGERSQAMQASQWNYSLDATQGIIPWVARSGKSFLSNDVTQEPLYMPSPVPPENTRSELAVPLMFGDEVLAVLDIQCDQPNCFRESDRMLFETLASTLAVSYRNASLYRTEKWRRQVAESFRDVAYQISNSVELSELLDHILAQLENNLPCDISSIWLADDREPNPTAQGQRLHLAAIRGADREQVTQTITQDPQALAELERHLEETQPYIRSQEDPAEWIGAALGYEDDFSMLVVPMHAGDSVLGLITLVHHTSGRYGSEAASMTSTFASYAAVAILNTRLFSEAQDQAWVATMLVQVAEATQSVLSVADLLATMLRLTRLLVGVRKCAFFLRLESQPFYELKAWYGFEPNHAGTSYYPVSLPALVHLEEERAMVYLDDPSIDLGMPEAAIPDSPSTVVLLPLLVRGEVTGAFLVGLQQPEGAAQRPSQIDAKSFSILQGISHQTSVTVENLRLLEARQEEAYVTAALLQVAQAVVSTSDLPEVLENIVHLLPILVGIDICMIYRWDEDLQVFRPSNAHGENRRQERFLLDNPYLPGEHHLLDSVLISRAAHICPVARVDVPVEDWPALSCIPLEDYQHNTHQVQGDWLLGFPLSAQNKVLGVLVVRESNATPAFRERRLEILSGIAQQTSLAIQNDLFKREMVQNERVEREIQLARQIQQTFLPDRLPWMEGWEIDVRWETARQVGGDFYDVFELPQGRMGFVIADVSDKGLPAALYMTVARTLIRAAVRVHDDPADVFGEVNQLLFTESPESMFITAVFAVLDPNKGELVYTNAGHNLPMLYRAETSEVELLPKGAMALGVLPDIQYEDHTLHIHPGDMLLMYTDGVCDTLSDQGEDFGDVRLRETTLVYGDSTAAELLIGIDQILDDFRQDTPLTDDITLLVLRRENP
ncbi:MAG TPA: GAF domain-containing protein [Anaerolinea sp.]|nr:GAF domain-containing protein [Anaerolinea sp.]